MKKLMLTLMLLMSVIGGAMAQNDAMYVYRNDGIVDLIYKKHIEQIEHTKGDVNGILYGGWISLKVKVGENELVYDLSQIDSLVFSTKQPRACQVRFDDMKDWDDCYMVNKENSNYFMFVKSSEYETSIRFVEYEDQSTFIDFYLDSNGNVYCIVKKDYLYLVDKNDDMYEVTKISSEGHVVDNFTVQIPGNKKIKRKVSADIPNFMMDVNSLLSGHRDFQNHNYSELSLSIMENAIVTGARLPGWASFLTQAGMEIFKQTFLRTAIQEYYQGCIPQITSVKDGKINVTIPNVDKINPNYSVYLTIAVRKGSDEISITNNDMLLPKVFVSSDNHISVNLPDLEIGTYHLMPILNSNYVKAEHPILKNSITSNGPLYTYKNPDVFLADYKQESLSFVDNTYYFTSTVTVKTDHTFGTGYFGIDVMENTGNRYEVLETFSVYGSEETEKKITLKIKLNSNSQSIKNKCIYLTPFVSKGGNKAYGDMSKKDLNISLGCPDDHHPHAIDLGLPSGTKWCCMNVGASSPEQYGGYYAWGETSEKSVYNWDTYQYGNSRDNCQNIGSDIAGTYYDVAHVRMGGSWRMPSLELQQELMNNCTRTWTQQNGVNGVLVTGKNGGQLFLPAAGSRWNSDLYDADKVGHYWSSTHGEEGPFDFDIKSGDCDWFGGYDNYQCGRSVRAVCP